LGEGVRYGVGQAKVEGYGRGDEGYRMGTADGRGRGKEEEIFYAWQGYKLVVE